MPTRNIILESRSPNFARRFRRGVLERVGVCGFSVEPKVPRSHHYDLVGTLLAGHRRFPRALFGFTFKCFHAALFFLVHYLEIC